MTYLLLKVTIGPAIVSALHENNNTMLGIAIVVQLSAQLDLQLHVCCHQKLQAQIV